MHRIFIFLLFFLVSSSVLVAHSPQRQLLGYYDGSLSLTIDSVRDLATSVINDSHSTPYFRSLAAFMIGYWHNQDGNKVSAATSYLHSLQQLNKADTVDLYLEINIRQNVGAILYTYELYNHSIQFYRQALPYAMEYSVNEQANLWFNLGNAYERLNSSSEAFSCYDKSNMYAFDYTLRQIQILNKKGLIEKNRERYEEARHFYQQIIERTEDLSREFQDYRAKAFHNLGVTYRLEQQYELATSAFHSAIALKRSDEKFISLKDLGEVYLQQGKNDMALKSWNEAEGYYSKMSLHPDYFSLFKLISTAYKSDHPLHLEYWKKYTSELEKYQIETDEIKRIAAKSYMGSLLSRYEDEVSEYEEYQASLLTGGVFLTGVITTLLYLLILQWWRKRKLARKVGVLNGTIEDIEATLLEAIDTTK